MTICYATREFFPFYYGGIGSHFYFQMKMMQSKGHKIIFITNEYQNLEKHLVEKYYDGIEIVFTDKSLDNFSIHQNLSNSYLLWQALEGLVANKDILIDFVIVPDCGGEGFFMILDQVVNEKYPEIKFLIEVEGPMGMVAYRNKDNVDQHFTITNLMEEFTFRSTKYFTFPTKIMMNELTDKIIVSDIKYKIVPNLVNNDFTIVQVKQKSVNKNIFFVGRLEYRKGADLLIQAFIQLIEDKNYSDTELFFVGKDQYWNDYNKTFQEYWCEKLTSQQLRKVHFLQFLPHDELKENLLNSHMAVFPSRWEPFGNVALEAILAGIPVIVPKGTGLEEIVDDEYDWLFKADDIEDLKKVLEKALLETEEDFAFRSELLIKRAKLVLITSEENFCEFIEEIENNKDSLQNNQNNSKLIYEIFSLYNLLNGISDKKFIALQQDYFKINQLYQDISRFYEELEKKYEILAEENFVLKKYIEIFRKENT